jgi:allantoin racemase
MTLGVIRVVSLQATADISEHGQLMEKFSGIRTVSMTIADQPHGVYDSNSEREAVPKIISLAERLSARADVDAVTVSCAADPAVDQLRRQLDTPVFGAGNSGASIARAAGSRVGVIGITEAVPAAIATVLGDSLLDYRNSDRAQQTTSLGNFGVLEALTEHASDLKDEGADVLLFACTGFSGIGLKEHLQTHVSIPIIDLVEAQATSYALSKGTP